MLSVIFNVIAGFLAGMCASMGLGGGLILILYLSIFTEKNQVQSGGINLVFFVLIATFTLIIRSKSKVEKEKNPIKWKKILPAILAGVLGSFIGSFLTTYIDKGIISKLFALFIFIVGIKELFSSYKKDNPPK